MLDEISTTMADELKNYSAVPESIMCSIRPFHLEEDDEDLGNSVPISDRTLTIVLSIRALSPGQRRA